MRVGLWALLLVGPSLGQVQKYAGTEGMMLFVLVVFGFWGVALRAVRSRAFALSDSEAWALALVTGLGLLILLFLLYPLADAGIVGGGSDRDDALDLAAREMVRGRCPYHRVTYLGNPIGVLPGGAILAGPFVFLGASAYQNLFWLAVFFLVARQVAGGTHVALLLVWAILFFSPVVLQQLATGGDLPANSIAVLLSVWLLGRARRSERVAGALLLGLALSWRVTFLGLVPLIVAWLGRSHGWRSALALLGLAAGVCAAVTLPFYGHDLQSFPPLLMQNKLARFDALYPHASVLIMSVTGALSLLSARTVREEIEVLRRGAVVLAFPIACALVLASLQAGRIDAQLAEYGVSALFFGGLGMAREIFSR